MVATGRIAVSTVKTTVTSSPSEKVASRLSTSRIVADCTIGPALQCESEKEPAADGKLPEADAASGESDAVRMPAEPLISTRRRKPCPALIAYTPAAPVSEPIAIASPQTITSPRSSGSPHCDGSGIDWPAVVSLT